jgi:predicted short-subunit dehydrogenase-like oxidoreductase (DUF2520 family)
MTTESPRIAFIGAGRVAAALARGFARAGYPVAAVASRRTGSAAAIAAAVEGCRAADSLQSAADGADIVFLTVPDDAIAPVAAAIQWRAGQSAVHCSGATELAALAPAVARGARPGGFHPLQNFADPETALAGLAGCVVAIEAEEPLAAALRLLAVAVRARPIGLPAGARALYHCAGSFAAPFVVAALHEAVKIWRGFGMTEQEALAALVPLTRGVLDAVERDGTVRALAGPIARGDVGTVTRHLDALARLGGDTAAFYRALAARVVPIAVEKGTLDAAKAAELARLLAGKG